MALISVIVPVYNVEEYLPRCIDSILAQSFDDFELILVDDGSTDRCALICDEYAEKDNRIRVIRLGKLSVSDARNAGIEKSSGEWLTFVDSDDWVHRDFLKVLVDGALSDSEVVICTSYTTNIKIKDTCISDTTCRSVSFADIKNNHMIRTRIWGRLFRREAIQFLRFIPGMEMHEDAFFNEMFFKSATKIRITDAKLYYYYQRPDSAIHNQMGKKSLESVKAMLPVMEKIEDRETRKRIVSRCCRIILASRFGELYNEDYSEVSEKCKRLYMGFSVYRKELDLKDKILYSIMMHLPFLYRAWRICDDPTLKTFEEEKRRKRKLEAA